MKQFSKARDVEEALNLAIKKGFGILDSADYFYKGGDFVFLEGDIYLSKEAETAKLSVPVLIGIGVLGRFFVKNAVSGKIIATESSGDLDNAEWYNEILNIVFVS